MRVEKPFKFKHVWSTSKQSLERFMDIKNENESLRNRLLKIYLRKDDHFQKKWDSNGSYMESLILQKKL